MSIIDKITDSGSTKRMRVAIAICTCNRPTSLQQLHRSLREADLSAAEAIILVDNHVSRNGQETWQALSGLPLSVIVVHEPEPGIASARNRAIQEARNVGVEAVAFVDDDELIAPDWLNKLVEHQRDTGAEIVAGPVMPLFKEKPSAWAITSGFYEQKQPMYEHAPGVNSTANVLICLNVLEGNAHPFNAAFGLSGGSDQVLFTALYNQGVKMSWCQRAVVFEEVPPSRLKEKWVKQRALRNGNINMRSSLYFATRSERRSLYFKYVIMFIPALSFGIVRLVLSKMGFGAREDANLVIFKTLGRGKALFGSAYLEYASRH